MRPFATEGVAWFVSVCVCVLVTTAILAKADEPIEMAFGEQTRKHTLAPPCEYE